MSKTGAMFMDEQEKTGEQVDVLLEKYAALKTQADSIYEEMKTIDRQVDDLLEKYHGATNE